MYYSDEPTIGFWRDEDNYQAHLDELEAANTPDEDWCEDNELDVQK